LFLVELEDLEIVVGEDLESDLVFIFSSIALLVGGFPLLIEILDHLFMKGSSESSYEDKGDEN